MHKIALLFFVLVFASLNAHSVDRVALENALAAQNPEIQARYSFRKPKETLEFFGIEPGMTVAEVLPGGGWYSKILLPYLGESGELVGINYPLDVWKSFSWMTPESLVERQAWPEIWPEKARDWGGENSASISAYAFDAIPDSADNSLDAILFIRALHNLARFNDKTGSLDKALAASYRLLKPGGIVGVVQHQAREDRSDEWADGSSGYIKRSFLVEQMEKAGFELIAESDINANHLDQAKEGDIVWRLLPSLRGSDETKEARRAIGESNRMTLKFQKLQR